MLAIPTISCTHTSCLTFRPPLPTLILPATATHPQAVQVLSEAFDRLAPQQSADVFLAMASHLLLHSHDTMAAHKVRRQCTRSIVTATASLPPILPPYMAG